MQESSKFNGDYVNLKEIDWTDKEVMSYHIDTRSFQVKLSEECLQAWEQQRISLVNIHQYTLTEEEVKELVVRYYNESGGDIPGRFFCLDGVENWNLKYLRFYRVFDGLIAFDRNLQPLKKDFLNRKATNNY